MIDCEKLNECFLCNEEDEEAKVEFTINSDVIANWAIKKIKEEQTEHDRLVDIAKAEIEELNRMIGNLDKALESKTGFLKGKLYEFFTKVEHRETKTQESYKLLDGSLVFKKPSQKLVKSNDEALTAYLEESQPELIEIIKKPAWGEFKKNLMINDGRVVDMATGEVLDFINIEEEPGKFDIK